MKNFPLYIAGCAIAMVSCKDASKSGNPYDGAPINPTTVVNTTSTPEANTFVAIHANILKPTCANSGCHDGTNVNDPAFPPIDFTTLEAAYSSLLKGPVRKNNEQNTYTYLVDPGNPEGSAVLGRLLDNDQNPGLLMPLEVDPDSEWNTKREQFIGNIRTWIQNGAPNAIGVPYSEGNAKPIHLGLVASTPSVNRLTRAGAKTEIQVPFQTQNVTFYFAFSDVETDPSNFTNTTAKVSIHPDNFNDAVTYELTKLATPFSEPGRLGTEDVTYTHSFSIDSVSQRFPANELRYIRVMVQDEQATPTEIPSNSDASQILQYFSFTRFNG